MEPRRCTSGTNQTGLTRGSIARPSKMALRRPALSSPFSSSNQSKAIGQGWRCKGHYSRFRQNDAFDEEDIGPDFCGPSPSTGGPLVCATTLMLDS